jgi:predicted DNA-binding transcriptional regulator AlpA
MADVLKFPAPFLTAAEAVDVPPLVVAAKALAVLLDTSERTIRTWDYAGKLPTPLRLGGAVVWRVDEIRAWLEAGAPDRVCWAAIRAKHKK